MKTRRSLGLVLLACLVFTLALLACSEDSDDDSTVDGDDSQSDGDDPSDDDDDEEDGDEEQADPDALELTVMTYNILCYFCDTVNYDPWEDRIGYHRETFVRHNPDLIGIQELFQLEDLDQLLEPNPEYEAIYYVDDGEGIFDTYTDAAIFYKKDRFDVVETGFYWLSDDPDTPFTGFSSEEEQGSRKASAFWRMVAWAVFTDRASGKDFYFSTTHFDNNTPHQEQSAPIALSYIQPYAERMPVVFVGDYNSKPDTIAYGLLTEGVEGSDFSLVNSFDLAEQWSVSSNLEPTPEYDPNDRIDHIFLQGPSDWTVSSWVVDMTSYGESGRYASDHFAMIATLRYALDE